MTGANAPVPRVKRNCNYMPDKQSKNIEGRRAQRGFVVAGIALITTAMLSGCHVDMWRQPYMKPYYQNDFFADKSSGRPLIQGTVPQGDLKTEDPIYYTGKGADGNTLVKTIPVRAVQAFVSPKAMLERGKDRYNAYCTPCHGKTGNGNGFITQRGLGYWQKLPASYHTDRLRKVEDGHIYDTITNGYGIMYGYASRIQDPNDRWAVVAYVRALQLMYEGQPVAGQTVMEPADKTTTLTNMPVPRPQGGPGLPVPAPNRAPLSSENMNREGADAPGRNRPSADVAPSPLPGSFRTPEGITRPGTGGTR